MRKLRHPPNKEGGEYQSGEVFTQNLESGRSSNTSETGKSEDQNSRSAGNGGAKTRHSEG